MHHSLSTRIIAVSAIALALAPSLASARTLREFGINAATYTPVKAVRKTKNYTLRDQSSINNEKRRKDVKKIFIAMSQYMRANEESVPRIIKSYSLEICRTGAGDCAGLIDFGDLLEPYLKEMPVDPTEPKDSNGTGYAIMTSQGRISVTSLNSEGAGIIRESSLRY